jgi:predicted phage terminase large subunit-like protein
VGGILRTSGWRVWPDDKPLPQIIHAFASWDTAFTERDLEANAYSACTVWGVWWDAEDRSGPLEADGAKPMGRHKLMLLSAWWDRVDFPALVDKAREVEAAKLKQEGDAHMIERKASGISMIQTLRRRQRVRVLGFDPKTDGGGDKVARAYGVQDLFRAGMVWAPNRTWARRVVEIVGEFPAGDALCKDLTDTVTQALTYLRKGWWINHPDDDAPREMPMQIEDEDEDQDRKMPVTAGRIYG